VKLLAIIFSFYILLLPALPCADAGAGKGVAQTEVSKAGCGSQHEEEACGPFCSCTCCGQIFTPGPQLMKVASIKPAVQKQSWFYKNVSLASNFLSSVWQPPKFS